MAGAKKKRKKPQQQSRRVPTFKEGTPNSYIKMYERIVRKHLQFLGLEPDFFEKLSKKTRLRMMLVKSTLPIFAVKKGHAVPGVYIRFFNQYMVKYLQTNQYGYDDIGYTYEDYYLVGLNFDLQVSHLIRENLVPPDQIERLRPALEAAGSRRVKEVKETMLQYMRLVMVEIMNCYSHINYRYYCFDIEFIGDPRTSRFSECYYIYSQEGERRVFKIDNINRTAMRVGVVLSGIPTVWVEIERGKITGSNSKELLPVYMQGHALQRMKERMNVSAIYRNLSFFYTFFRVEKTEMDCDIHGRKLIPVYDDNRWIVGYFVFSIIDNCIVIKSFLPLSSPNTMEGNKLYKLLNMEKEDLVYWGLDKHRFYLETDFERIPVLKKALQDAGLWHLTMIQSTDSEYHLPTERKADILLEKFFENYKLKEITEEEVEDGITEPLGEGIDE
jgi:hypothetical protein